MAKTSPAPGKAVTMFAQKLKSRCAVLLRQGEREDRRKGERLPCNLKIEIQTGRGPGHPQRFTKFPWRACWCADRAPSGCR